MHSHYERAGVSLKRGDDFVDRIAGLARATRRPEVMEGLGGYAALFRFPKKNYQDPILVSSTDGIGTKVKLARNVGRLDGLGQDLVAMCVNDLICVGAEPLFFLDYYASGKINPTEARTLIAGISRALKEIRCALVGGETAEMPGVYPPGEFDLAGFVVGAVDRKRLITGRDIRPGDLVFALPSSGPHSNGYSLIRRIVEINKPNLNAKPSGFKKTLGLALLEPTRIYVNSVLSVARRYPLKGIAHITGSGLIGNIPRILPKGTQAVLESTLFPRMPVFDWIAKTGNVSWREMYEVFNCGIGLVIVVAPRRAAVIQNAFDKLGEETFLIGEIQKQRQREPQVIIV